MKNILNLVVLSIFLITGMQVSNAQGLPISNDRPEAIAKKKVAMIYEVIELSGEQERALFRAYVKREVGIKKHVAGKDGNDPVVQQQKNVIDNELTNTVQKELTSEQFEKWKEKFSEMD